MPKRFIFLLLAGFLLFSAGCGQTTADAIPTEELPQSSTATENAMAVYNCGGIQIALPVEYLDQLIVKTGDGLCEPEEELPAYPQTLMMVYEKASVDAAEADYGNADGIGFLWGFCVLDQVSFEQLLSSDGRGFQLFAKADELYYVYCFPTDVQFHRNDLAAFTPDSQDFRDWETLNDLGPQVRDDIVERNDLTPYSAGELRNQDFTYASTHAYVEYYPYFTIDGSKREFYTLVLSQPVTQGEGGIWCVERMYDEYGTLYLHFPDTGMAAMDYYRQLQAECDAGRRNDVLTPPGAATLFVEEDFFGSATAKESFEVTVTPNTAYMETNQETSRLISSLLAGREVDDMKLLECMGGFTTDNWGVLGRRNYGSDWWRSLQTALEHAATGENQEARDRNMMKLYLGSCAPYTETILDLLRTQQDTDRLLFAQVLTEFTPEEQTLLRTVLAQ